MSGAAAEISLPLLTRELTELAARRRTYAIRVLYAFVLLFSAWLAFRVSTLNRSVVALDYLGSGAIMLWWTGYLQNIGLLIVLPALTCDVFTREKERQTLNLLFITRLSPATIVMEKFLSRLFPAVCLLLISLPMLGFSYSLGGVEAWQVVNAAFGLMTNAIVLTAIAVACSSFCHSTIAAYMWTYAIVLVTPLMVISGRANQSFDFILFGRYLSHLLNIDRTFRGAGFGGILPSATDTPLMMCVTYLVGCLPSLVVAALALLLARKFLVSRAAKRPQETALFRKLMGLGNRAPSLDEAHWPDIEPVAWRETHKSWVTRPRLHWALLVTLLLIVALAAEKSSGPQFAAGPTRHLVINFVALGMWAGMLFVLIAATANLITQERGQQTLHVLLTTPMFGHRILREKLVGIQKLRWTFLIPLAVCLVLRMLVATPYVHRQSAGRVDYPMAFINEITMLWIYPQVVLWMALYYSLKSKTTIAAILKTVLTIVLQCILPWMLLMLVAICMGGFDEDYFWLIMLLLMIGPENLLLYGYSTDCIPPGFDQNLVPLIVNSLIHGGIWWRLQRKCLTEADRLLGRNAG